MAKATVLTYTEKELEAIEILKQNRGQELTAAELGLTTAILTSLGKKAEKVNSGELANPENLEVLDIKKGEKVIQVTVDKVYKTYSI